MKEGRRHKVYEQARALPHLPGVYRFYDREGRVIYVGKAKDLRKRVLSYFSKPATGKHALLMRHMDRVDHIVTENETEAFLLENIQIKHHKPKYNILLKDDKTYPWIVIRKEHFPRVELTRRWEKGTGEYFGPYASVFTARTLLNLIHELYPLRTCKWDLSPDKIARGRYKVCLDYHLGRCMAPCIGKQSEEEYLAYIRQVREILKGNFGPAMEYLKARMKAHADKLEFEKAQQYKEKIEALQHYQARSTVVNPKLGNVAVFSLVPEPDRVFINFMEIGNGAIVRARNLELKRRWDESDAELLATAIAEVFNQTGSRAKEIILPMHIDLPLPVRQTVPQKGDKKKLLDLSTKNARYFKIERLKQLQIKDPEAHTRRLLAGMKEDLRLPAEPAHIECFDISHTQGTEKTASCVVFKNAKPSKKDYRHFRIRTVEGIDDYASMREAVYRRYKRLLDERAPLPQLVVIDGGKGQLNAALESIRQLGLEDKIQLIGIAKRLEEIYRPGDPLPLYLDKRSETLKVIQHIRNEAHRFGLRLHRNRRAKQSIHTQLTAIPGIGEKTAVKLLKLFGSLKKIREASLEELQAKAGPKTGRLLYDYFHSPGNAPSGNTGP